MTETPPKDTGTPPPRLGAVDPTAPSHLKSKLSLLGKYPAWEVSLSSLSTASFSRLWDMSCGRWKACDHGNLEGDIGLGTSTATYAEPSTQMPSAKHPIDPSASASGCLLSCSSPQYMSDCHQQSPSCFRCPGPSSDLSGSCHKIRFCHEI